MLFLDLPSAILRLLQARHAMNTHADPGNWKALTPRGAAQLFLLTQLRWPLKLCLPRVGRASSSSGMPGDGDLS